MNIQDFFPKTKMIKKIKKSYIRIVIPMPGCGIVMSTKIMSPPTLIIIEHVIFDLIVGFSNFLSCSNC